MAHCLNMNFCLIQKITLNNVQNRRVLVFFLPHEFDLLGAITKLNNGDRLLSSVLLFKDATKIQNGCRRSTPNSFVTTKTETQIKFYDMEIFSKFYWKLKCPLLNNFNFFVDAKI